MRYLLALLFLGVATSLQAGTVSGSMDDIIAAEWPASGAPGLAYAIVEDGEITSGTYGEVLKGSGKSVTPDTPFLIGSISKSFTALAVMKLVEADNVALDDEISQYLATFADQPAGEVTIRQLLSHTSGFSTRQGNDTHKDRSQNGDDLSGQVARLAQRGPAHAPGTRWQYSNANYLILGVLIEEVSGRSYAEFIESEILVPMGMEHSFVADGKTHDEMAVGHQPWFGTARPLKNRRTSRATAPAGGIVATASDMARYLAMMTNGQDDIISAESKSAMLSPASDASPFYGFGWFLDARNGTAYHGGLTPGVETLATLSLKDKKGVVVLVNANSGMGVGIDTEELLNGITAKALGLDNDGAQSDWGPRSLFLTFALLPLLFVAAAVRAVTHREGLRSKSGLFGVFSLWFPLLMTLVLAWVALVLIPQLFGVPLRTLYVYQPDFVLLLIASAATGVAWAALRLGVAFSRKAVTG